MNNHNKSILWRFKNFMLEVLVQLTVIAGFIGAGINYIVIKPLESAINKLSNTISKFEKVVDNLERNQNEIDKRLIKVEERIDIVNQRIAELEKR